MAFPLTFDDMRTTNEAVRPVLDDLRSIHRRWMERAFPRSLTSNEAVTLSAVVARTFGWRKVVEAIPVSTFIDGMRDPATGKLRLDDRGVPLWCGIDLDKKTLRKALDGLVSKGLIARFNYTGGSREAFAYMPLSAFALHSYVARFADRHAMELPQSVIAAVRTPVTNLEDAFACRLGLIDTDEPEWE